MRSYPGEQPLSQTDQSYTVIGMTCEHCVQAVTEEVGAIPAVTDVRWPADR